jgi:hypothetical protein
MTTSDPSEGQTPRDPQSETVSAPHGDPDPPRRTKTAGLSTGVLLLLWVALGLVLLATALKMAG